MTQEVLRLQAIGALLPCRKTELKYCSSVFLVEKPGPKQFRMVVNMKPVNWKWWEQDYSFKMEGLKGFLAMAWIGAWAVTWDLAEGFFHLMLDYLTSLYFGIEFEGNFYRYRVATFGWVKSMYFFSKLMAVAKRWWRLEFAIPVWSHVDDFCALFHSEQQACQEKDEVLGPELEALGLIREPTKGCWDKPTQQPVIYGFQIDLAAETACGGRGLITIPDQKKQDLALVLTAVVESVGCPASARFMAKVCGKVVSAQMAFSPAKAWSAEFFWAIDCKNRPAWAWDRKDIWISEDLAEDASFLIQALQDHNGRTIWPGFATVLLRWDASMTGWGAAIWTDATQTEPIAQASGHWKFPMTLKHINDLEPHALLRALYALEPFLTGRVIKPQGDSVTANAAVSNFRGSVRSKERNQVTKLIWAWAQEAACSLLPVEYVNTKDNDWADARSREFDMSDWEISDAVWRLIDQRWGPHTWDRFAAVTNTRCSKFTARFYQPGCHWPDSLTQDWSGENNYACPPETLLLQALRKVEQSDAEATFIVPSYPAKWWPTLARIRIEQLELPPPSVAFQPGPSGHVEPWKPVGTQQQRAYLAVRVRGSKALTQRAR
jgi:hypothetical protein